MVRPTGQPIRWVVLSPSPYNNKVIGGKLLRPAGLSPSTQFLIAYKARKGFVISNDTRYLYRCFEVVTPLLERYYNREHLLITRSVILFSRRHLLREKRDRVLGDALAIS